MLIDEIRKQLDRLNLHPVNLGVSSVDADQVYLGGSLLPYWEVPNSVDGPWLLGVLTDLPDAAGGKATMEAFFAAHVKKTACAH